MTALPFESCPESRYVSRRRAPRMAVARWRRRTAGTALVEAVVVLPTFLFAVLAVWQAALVFYAKSSVNYATYEAARAASVNGASQAAMNGAFRKAMAGYYGGGTTPAQLLETLRDVVAADVSETSLRIQVISPTVESFEDYNSPALQAQFNSSEPVIPNSGLDELTCPRDVPDCNADPRSNRSGQTLLDANLLKLRVTYGIPQDKQMPLVGRFYTWALAELDSNADDPFIVALIAAKRIPIVTTTVMRMHSDIVRNSAMTSSPGSGNDGHPVPPEAPAPVPALPNCPWWDPGCSLCQDGVSCAPETCSGSATPAP